MTNQQAPETLRPIARYKIGYATDDWDMRPSTPSGIPDRAGAWVRYEDHVTALAAGQALSAAPAGFVPVAAFDRLHAHAESLAARLLAASPTPPAEQQAAPKAAPGEPSDADIDAFLDSPGGIEWVIADKRERYRLLVRAVLAKWAAPQQEAQEPTEIPEEIERMAADRYKVVPSHESMFHRWAVVAGTGTQQLYLGREVECQNMARKFAGAFLDGAFVAMQRTAPQPAPAPVSDDTERLEWLLWKLPGDALRYVVGELADTSSGSEFRAAIDAALAAQGGAA